MPSQAPKVSASRAKGNDRRRSGRIAWILIDRLLDQTQAQDAGIEIDIGRGVAGDGGDVVQAV